MIIYNGADYTAEVDDKLGAINSIKKGKKEFVCQNVILPLFAFISVPEYQNGPCHKIS